MPPKDQPTQAHREPFAKLRKLATPKHLLDLFLSELSTTQIEPNPRHTLSSKAGHTLAIAQRTPSGIIHARVNGAEIYNLPRPERPPGPSNRPNVKVIRRMIHQHLPAIATILVNNHINTPEEGTYNPEEHGTGRWKAAQEFIRRTALQHMTHHFTDWFNAALQQLSEPEIVNTLQYLHGQLSLYKYNAIARSADAYISLSKTNPGIAAWALARELPDHHLRHPGQIVTLAKTDLLKNGLSPANWRKVATAPPESVRVTRTRRPPIEDSCAALNAMANAQAFPGQTSYQIPSPRPQGSTVTATTNGYRIKRNPTSTRPSTSWPVTCPTATTAMPPEQYTQIHTSLRITSRTLTRTAKASPQPA